MKNTQTILTLEAALQMRESDVAALALDADRRDELEVLQSDLMGLLEGVDSSSKEWSAISALLIASVDNLLWSQLHSFSALSGTDELNDAYQVAITRLLRAFQLWSPAEFGNPVAYLTQRVSFASKDGRRSVTTAREARKELIIDEESDALLGSASPSPVSAHPSDASFVFSMEAVCALAGELALPEKKLVASPLAFWSIQNAGRLEVSAQEATVTSFIR